MLSLFKNNLILDLCLPLAVSVFAISQALTSDFVESQNYPVEEHLVDTDDGYMVTIYRIPHSPKLPCTKKWGPNFMFNKPVVLLQHGFVLSSDSWVLHDASDGLAYLLADAGYDVWLGNQRGNNYARQHKNLSSEEAEFWNFSFHEIGYYDLAGMIDYILHLTHERSLHFVGYSQGATLALVLLASRTEYAEKVKSLHFLAPVAYMNNTQHSLARASGWFLQFFTMLTKWWDYHKVLHFNGSSFYRKACSFFCGAKSPLLFLCRGLYGYISGPGSQQINEALLSTVCVTHPTGTSSKQLIHILQIIRSGEFYHYDYGSELNMIEYRQATPPLYDIASIANCVNIYYSDNDCLLTVPDVERLANVLPCTELHRMPLADWNHYDFMWSTSVGKVLNERIIAQIKQEE